MEPTPSSTTSTTSRRAVTTGLAWAAPAVAIATAAPAMAATPEDPTFTSNYRFRSYIYSRLKYGSNTPGEYCTTTDGVPGVPVTEIHLSNYNTPENTGTSPHGFAVVQMASSTGAPSPTTQATVGTPLQLVVAYPQGLVDLNSGTNGFRFAEGTQANWSGPTRTQTTTTSSTHPGGLSLTYDVFTFTWRGAPTQDTVLDGALTGTRTAAWPMSGIDGYFTPSPYYCSTHFFRPQGSGNTDWYYSGYYMNGTAANLRNTRGQMGTFTVAQPNSVVTAVGPISDDNWIQHVDSGIN